MDAVPRSDRSKQMCEFGLERTLVKEMLDILVKIRIIQRADALLQTPFQHQLFTLRQLDTDLGLDQLGNRAEMAIRQVRRSVVGERGCHGLRRDRRVAFSRLRRRHAFMRHQALQIEDDDAAPSALTA
jgi:hypothetical protein